MNNAVCRLTGCDFPLFAFSHCRDVVVAVSKAGGFGVLGAAAFSPEQLDNELDWIDAHIEGKPYGVDVLVPETVDPRVASLRDPASRAASISDEHRAFTADLLNRPHVLLVERIDDVAHFLALRGQLDADRAAIDARTLVIEEFHLHKLLEIVGDVGAEIITARAQFAGRQFLVTDVVEQQRLHRVDVGATAAVEFVLDDIEQAAMQPLNQRQGFLIEWPDGVEPNFTFSRFDRLRDGFHV